MFWYQKLPNGRSNDLTYRFGAFGYVLVPKEATRHTFKEDEVQQGEDQQGKHAGDRSLTGERLYGGDRSYAGERLPRWRTLLAGERLVCAAASSSSACLFPGSVVRVTTIFSRLVPPNTGR